MEQSGKEFFEKTFKENKKKHLLIFNDLYNDFLKSTGLTLVSKGILKAKLKSWCKENNREINFSITNFGNKSMQIVLIEPQKKEFPLGLLAYGLAVVLSIEANRYATKKTNELLEKIINKSK